MSTVKNKAAVAMARQRWKATSDGSKSAHGRLMAAARNAPPDTGKPVLDLAGLVKTFGHTVNFFRVAIQKKRLPVVRRPGGAKNWVLLDVAAKYLQQIDTPPKAQRVARADKRKRS